MSNIVCAVNMFYFACIKINLVCILKRESRQNYLNIWKKILLPKKYQASQQASTARQQPFALPHHGPNSGLAKTNKASRRERNELPQFRLIFCFATLQIVVPQFQNSLLEICHEAEVSSSFFIKSLVA
jgi:hypothetical protein